MILKYGTKTRTKEYGFTVRKIEMLSESMINYFKTELLDNESQKAFNARLFEMNVFAGIEKLLDTTHTAEEPEIIFPLAVITATIS